MKISPLRQFVLAAALWLPACFFLWAVLSSAVVWPIGRLSHLIVTLWLPEVFSAVDQFGSTLEFVTRLQVETDAQGRVGVLVLTDMPLVYAWCVALHAGLVMATPVRTSKWLVQLGVGFVVLTLVCTWGAVSSALKQLALGAGPLGAAAISNAGLAPDAVALAYQFGYLILPAVTPIALWVIMNREFLEELVGWRGELEPTDQGPTATDVDASKASDASPDSKSDA